MAVLVLETCNHPLIQLTDEALMQLVKRGDLDKARVLFDRYQVRIYNYCLHLCGDRELSKDLCQEVFYKLLKFRDTYKSARFSTWLYTIARNLCYDQYKQQQQTEKQIKALQLYNDQVGEEAAHPEKELSQLEKALKALPMAERELIVMSKYQGMKYREIADITNTSEGAARTKTHRVLRKLKRLYFKNIDAHGM